MDRPKVMVRGYRDRPTTLFLNGIFNNRIEVTNGDGTATIRIPFLDVYEYDEAILDQLDKATDDAARALVWRCARHVNQQSEVTGE